MEPLKVLMTGAGAPGAHGIIRCYRNNCERKVKVYGVDARERVQNVQYLDWFQKIPFASEDSFINAILDIAIDNQIQVIQPLVTKELEKIAESKSVFEKNGIAVCVDSAENLKISNDKGKLLDKLFLKGVAVPGYRKVINIDGFSRACRELGYPNETVCFKPSKSNGSRGFRIVDDGINRGDLLFNQKPNNLFISFQDALNILGEMEAFPELLVMEYLPGDEYSIDMLVDKGMAIYTIPRLRNIITAGISTECTVVNDEVVIAYCNDIAKALNLNGNIGIQVRKDGNGEVKILEINPRVQGSIVCCAAAGVNLPYFGIKQALGEVVPVVDIHWGVTMKRRWEEEYFDAEGRPFTY